ncbi:MAG: restriction endonuclease subunit S [Christensenellales bacterium]
MKCEWKRIRVGDLGTIITGKTPPTKKAEYWGGNIHFITPKDLQGTKHVLQTDRFITGMGLESVRGCKLPSDAVCVSCIGNIGYVAMTRQTCISNQQINSIIANENYDPDFVYYLMKSLWPFFKNYEGQSTTLSILNKTQFSKIEIVTPDLPEQKKIASILSSLDDKIELNNKINENLQQQVFALFDKLVFDSDNAKCHVSDIAYLNPKRTLSKNQMARCIDMSQLSTIGAFPSGWEMKPFAGGMRFMNGDTLLARITPCLENGKAAFIDFLDQDEVAFGSTEYIVLAPKEGIPAEFLYCLARYPAFVDYAVKNMNGSSGRQRVSAETIGQFVLPKIMLSEIKLFEKKAVPLFRKMRYNSLENICLAQMRDIMLPKLMTGEIEV